MALHSGEPPATLSNWEHWRKEAGVRGSNMVKATEGIDLRKREKSYIGYAWSLDGKDRFCEICGIDMLKGEQAVHPVRMNTDKVTPLVDMEVGFHPRCLTRELWDLMLGPPMAAPKVKITSPRVTDEAVRQAVETGAVQLVPGVSVEEAVDRLRALRGQTPTKRD